MCSLKRRRQWLSYFIAYEESLKETIILLYFCRREDVLPSKPSLWRIQHCHAFSICLPNAFRQFSHFRNTQWMCSFVRCGWIGGWCTMVQWRFWGWITWWWLRCGHQTLSSGMARSQLLTTWQLPTSCFVSWRMAPSFTPWGIHFYLIPYPNLLHFILGIWIR